MHHRGVRNQQILAKVRESRLPNVPNFIKNSSNNVSSHQPVPYHAIVPSHISPQIPGISQVCISSLPGTKSGWAIRHWSPQ